MVSIGVSVEPEPSTWISERHSSHLCVLNAISPSGDHEGSQGLRVQGRLSQLACLNVDDPDVRVLGVRIHRGTGLRGLRRCGDPDCDRGGDQQDCRQRDAEACSLRARESHGYGRVTTSSGRSVAASRALKSTPSADVVASVKL